MPRLCEGCRTALVWDPEACGKRSLCACFFDTETGRMKCCTPCELFQRFRVETFPAKAYNILSIVIIRVTESSALLYQSEGATFCV